MPTPLPQRLARWAGAIVFLGGIEVLAGWVLGIDTLIRIHPAWPKMAAISAATSALAGVCLWCAAGGFFRISSAGAAIVASVGIARLSEWLFGWPAGVSTLLFREPPGT